MRFTSITISALIHVGIGIWISLHVLTEERPTETVGINTITISKYFEIPQDETPETYDSFEEPILPEIVEHFPEASEEIEEFELPELPKPEAQAPIAFHEIPLGTVKRPESKSQPAPEVAPSPPPSPPKAVPTPIRVPARSPPGKLQAISTPRFYPPEAIRAGLEGTVYVILVISPQGSVVKAHVSISSGFRILDNAAVFSVRRWVFSPPGSFRKVRVPFTFRIVA